MRRIAEILGVVALVAIYGFLLAKQDGEFEQEYEKYCSNSTSSLEEVCDTSSMNYLEEDCLGLYKDITFADTTRILNRIYNEREMITNACQAIRNCHDEVGVRMRIVELEREKANAALPPNMRVNLTWKWLHRFLVVTMEYYDKLYGKDHWNYVLALDDTIRELERWAKEERRAYKDAMEAYHGEKSDDDCEDDCEDICED